MSDLLLLYGCSAVGLVVIGIAWLGARGSGSLASQVRWVNVGVGGLIVFGAGILTWLLAGRRAVGELRRHVIADIASREAEGAPGLPGARPRRPASPEHPPGDALLVSAPGMRHFHRPNCIFVAGKHVDTRTERSFRRQRRTPCPVCLAVEEDER